MASTGNKYLDFYKDLRRDIFSDKKESRNLNKSVPLDCYVEWDRLRMILNPRAKLSLAQKNFGIIPESWRG